MNLLRHLFMLLPFGKAKILPNDDSTFTLQFAEYLLDRKIASETFFGRMSLTNDAKQMNEFISNRRLEISDMALRFVNDGRAMEMARTVGK